MKSHDQNFKNLFSDFPRQALEETFLYFRYVFIKLLELEIKHLEFLYLKNEPQRAQSSREDRKVLKYIFA